MRVRVIPVLLLSQRAGVKTTRFKKPLYVGDPLNIVRVWNSKEVDELILLDIDASKRHGVADLEFVAQVASEAFMPITYGGAVRSVAEARRLIVLGVEKVAINTATFDDPMLVRRLSGELGTQCVVASVDVEKTRRGYRVVSHAGRRVQETDPLRWVDRLVSLGAGEVLLNAVHRDGTKEGFDLDLLGQFAGKFDVPIIACGGAASVADVARAASRTRLGGFAAGALFIYEGPHRAVLPTYLSSQDFAEITRAAEAS